MKAQMRDISLLFHDLGVILHHQDDYLLRDFIILNPQWAINAVYEILKHDQVKRKLGRFSKQLLNKIWTDLNYSTNGTSSFAKLDVERQF